MEPEDEGAMGKTQTDLRPGLVDGPPLEGSGAAGAPARTYGDRLARRREGSARVERLYNLLSNLRLLVFAVFLLSLWLVWGAPDWPLGVALVPPALFLGLVVGHEFVAQRLTRSRRAVRYYEVALARLDDRWVGVGPTGGELLDPRHPYAADLDLFGHGSVFQRLSLARTRFGERTLASWLLAPASSEEIAQRQEAVRELRPELDLRESLALEGEEMEQRGDPEAFVRWALAPPALPGRGLRLLVGGLVALTALALAGATTLGWGWSPFLLCLMAQIVLRLRIQRRLLQSTADLEEVHDELALLSAVLRSFESSRFVAPWLVTVQERLRSEDRPPSIWIRRLDRLFDLYEARRNSLFAPISFVFLLDLLVGLAFDEWRRRVGAKAELWLRAVGELEAVSSLAGYAFERPEDVFPTVRGEPSPFLRAEALGHALLPADRCVRNDLVLGGDVGPQLLVVSGSNMSGKSTLLRTVGTAVVLAQMGAPVRAGTLELGRIRLGASIRVQDSIQEGVSRFYAEVKRLRQIVERTEEGADVLFLVDEILQGTNSHDRRVGVEAVMRTLVERGAIGMITTHDLALTEMVGRLGGRADNVHFEDQLADGEMSFDYRLRPGVVSKSNALELMRSVGLDVRS